MARTELKAISVYVTEEQNDLLAHAAALSTRSLSNFLLALGLEKAEELGARAHKSAMKNAPAKKKAAGGR